MSALTEKEKEFERLYNNATQKIYDGYCFVQEVTIDKYTGETSVIPKIDNILKPYSGAQKVWKEIVNKNNWDMAMYELHILSAIAIAIAVKVFLCPDVEILMGFTTSKYTNGESDYWWAISPSAPQGLGITTKKELKEYLTCLKKGTEIAIENDNNFDIVKGVLKRYTGSEQNVVVPDTVSVIGEYAFGKNSQVKTVVLPDSVTEIQTKAFVDCKNLVSITISANIKKIGKDIFGGYRTETESLASIIPSPNIMSFEKSPLELMWKVINEEFYGLDSCFDQVRKIAISWLANNYNVIKDSDLLTKKFKYYRKTIIEQCISEDNRTAIENLFSMITFNFKVDEINEYFKKSTDSKSENVAAYLSEYQSAHFTKKQISTKTVSDPNQKTLSEWKKIFQVEEVDDGVVIIKYKQSDSTVEIPAYMGKKRVVALNADSFYYGHTKNISIPDSVVFSRKSFKQSVTVVKTDEYNNLNTDTWIYRTLKDGTLKLVYYNEENTENVQIPGTINGKQVSVLGSLLFANHKEIRSINIPSEIREIETDVFSGCELENVHLSEGLEKIGRTAFRYCGLQVLDVPTSVKTLDGGSLSGIDTVIIRGNPQLIVNLDIFKCGSIVYANSNTEVYAYCCSHKCKIHTLDELSSN